MRIPKRYGQSKVMNCPFCNKNSITNNKQGIPVCRDHKDQNLQDLKCVCGDYLDLKPGKYGPYFNCMNCGNMNFSKAMEINPTAATISEPAISKSQFKITKSSQRTQTITAEEADVYFT